MSDLPTLVKSAPGLFPFEGRLNSPHGSLGRGSVRLTNGVALRVVGKLQGGGFLALLAEGTWISVLEHWVDRETRV